MGHVTASREVLSEAHDDPAPRSATAALRRALRPRQWPVIAAWVLGVAVGFTVYLQLARTRAVNSDGASQALQAWDMLHGNPLLRGWTLSDVSFYTTELPQYMLVELARGLNADVVHVAAAMTYTLAILLAALLAKGNATGRAAVPRVLLAAGVMLAPQLDSGVNVLVSSPDHIGTSVPVMVAWLILDRARPRWYVPVVTAAILGWAQVADVLVLYVGVLPLVLVCAFRAGRAVLRERRPLSAQWYDLALAGCALVAAAAAMLTLHLIHSHGGFYAPAPATQFAKAGLIFGHNLRILGEGLLLLGGADFIGMHAGIGMAFTVLHLAGVFLAAWAICLTAWRFLRERDLVIQLLFAGLLINLATYVISTHAQAVSSTREIAAVLPLGAALTGRQLAGRLMSAKPVPVLLGAVLLGYLAGLVHEISQPMVPAQNQQLTTWLEARHMSGGLSGYWQSNIVTLTSGDRVQIRLVSPGHGRLARGVLETRSTWYDPHRSTADFVVLSPGVPGYTGFSDMKAVLAAFGKPARVYHVGGDTVLVWHKNLLAALR